MSHIRFIAALKHRPLRQVPLRAMDVPPCFALQCITSRASGIPAFLA